MSLQKFCQQPVITIAPEQTIFEACQMLREKNVGCLVVQEGGALCGILTDRDISLQVTGKRKNPRRTTVREIMTANPVHLAVNKTLHDLTSLMHMYHVRRVPIVESGNKVVGLVTLDDLIILLGEEWSDMGEGILGALQQAEADLTEVTPPFGWLMSYL